MQILRLTWVPTNKVFAQPKTFEEAISVATTRVLRAGYRSFNVTVMDDGESFEVTGLAMEQGRDVVKYIPLVAASPAIKVHHLAATAKAKEPVRQRSHLQNIQGKPPASGWYKGQGRRLDLAAGDPRREGPYFLAVVNEEDLVLQHQNIEPLVRRAGQAGAEYPLDAVLAGAEVSTMLQAAKEQGATFAVVLRDDAPPKLRFKDKWDGSARSLQVVYRRPL